MKRQEGVAPVRSVPEHQQKQRKLQISADLHEPPEHRGKDSHDEASGFSQLIHGHCNYTKHNYFRGSCSIPAG